MDKGWLSSGLPPEKEPGGGRLGTEAKSHGSAATGGKHQQSPGKKGFVILYVNREQGGCCFLTKHIFKGHLMGLRPPYTYKLCVTAHQLQRNEIYRTPNK